MPAILQGSISTGCEGSSAAEGVPSVAGILAVRGRRVTSSDSLPRGSCLLAWDMLRKA